MKTLNNFFLKIANSYYSWKNIKNNYKNNRKVIFNFKRSTLDCYR